MKVKVRSKIGELMKDEGRSQTWLASKIGSTQQQVSDWCKGTTNPSIGYILRIMKATGWKLEDMFEEERV